MTDFPILQPGIAGSASLVVTQDKTAQVLGSGNVNVFSTPAMIALLEEAAVEALRPYLAEGQTSVGTSLNVKHRATTPVGINVKLSQEIRVVRN